MIKTTGKSNLMDAISYVLGESTKNLRVRRMADLIHGASVSQPTSKDCSVKMVFQYADEERTTKTFQRSQNEFRVDDQKVSLVEYHKALEGINIFIKVNWLKSFINSTI
jgi:structural maintenance of chromosome 1